MTYYQKTDLIDGLYTIEFDQPLPLLSDDEMDAYVCSSTESIDRDLIAYVLKTDYPPRLNVFKAASKGVLSEDVKTCVKIQGILEGGSDYTYVLITAMEKRLSTRTSSLKYNELLKKHYVPDFKAIEHDDDLAQVVGSLHKALLYLEGVDVYHGRIRPDNIFFNSEGGFHTTRIGGCFVKPAGSSQPVLYETINRGMCKPSVRGAGTTLDDIYSLGVALLVLFLGEEPLKGLTEEEILLRKIDDGSYKALLKDIDLSPMLTVFFKGVLCDDVSQRWELVDIEKWLLAKRGRKVLVREHRVKRAIIIGGIHCYSKRSAAYAIAQYKHESMTLLMEGKIQAWLDYACDDSAARQRVTVLLDQFQQGKVSDDHLITEVCAVMAPENPMFYSGLVICPNSLSKIIFESAGDPKMKELIRTLLLNNIFMSWITTQPANTYLGQIAHIEKYYTLYKGQGLNRGFEALFYSLNTNAYCRSPFVKKYKPNTVSELCEVLEKVAGEVNIEEAIPLDKELVCFIDARENAVIAPFLADLNDKNDRVGVMNAIVNLYALLQKTYVQAPLPNFTKWMGRIVLKNFNKLKDKDEFIKLNKLLKKRMKTGMVEDLCGFANVDVYKGDNIRFHYSKRVYEQMNGAIDELKSSLGDSKLLYEKIGRPFSAFVSIGISMIIMFTSLVILIGA